MFYYYMVRLANRYDTLDKDIIKDYIKKKKFKSFDDANISKLASKNKKPFNETLRSVFSHYIKIEHKLAKSMLMNFYGGNNVFVEEYFDSIKDYGVKKSEKNKYRDVIRIHGEDSRFMKGRRDNFLTFSAENDEKSSDSIYSDSEEEKESPLKENYDQVLILLDENKEYLGHIYVWSWLTTGSDYLNLFTLKFAGIRTSIRNLASKRVRKISTILINIIATWGKNHGYEYIEVGLSPMGTMRDNLINCGFDENENIIYIDNIKCYPEKHFIQLMPITDVFHLKDSSYLEEWYDKEKARDETLIRNMWFSYDIASDIHKIYKMTYPDRKPSKYELEYVYTLTFVNKYGYLSEDIAAPLYNEKSIKLDMDTKIVELKQIDLDLSKLVKSNILDSTLSLFKLKAKFIKFTSWYEKAIYSIFYNGEIMKREIDIKKIIKQIRDNFYYITDTDLYRKKIKEEFYDDMTDIKLIVSNMMMLE